MLTIKERKDTHAIRHEAMATDFIFALGGVDLPYAKQVAHEAFRLIDDLEAKLSLYRESSDVSRINLARSGQTVTVSAECAECLRVAMEASQLTNDRFQIFVGQSACRAKGFIPPHLSSRIEEIAHLSPGRNGGEAIALDVTGRQVTRLRDDAFIDLGGIGKGFALDQIVEVLEDWEVPVALLSASGSTHLFRCEESSPGWEAELDGWPLSALYRSALASSGLGFQERHIIDPRTGESSVRWQRSYVQAPTAGLSDALSTAAMLMEWTELLELARHQTDIGLAVEDAEGNLRRCGGPFEPR